MAELITAGEFATEGERRAAEHLRNLPDRWVVICNKTLPTSDGRSYEIDFIIIASRWVFVLDEKSWRGKISGSDQEWVRADGSAERSPLNKIEAVARVMAGHLRASVPALRNEKTHCIYGGVLLSCAMQLPAIRRDSRVANQVFLFERVLERLPKIDKQGGSSKISSARDAIKNVLVDLSNRPAVPKTIGLYQIEEVTDHHPGVRLLRARTEHDVPRLLMMYDLGKDPTNAQQLKEFYQREFAVLQRLQSSGFVPEALDPFLWSDDFLILPIRPPDGKILSEYPFPETRDELAQELLMAEACFKGLAHIHDQGILHRALGPDVISIVHSGKKIQVQFTNFFAARIEERSIALTLDLLELEDPYAHPELAGSYGCAIQQTDLWSLALIFLVRLARISVKEARSALSQSGKFPSLRTIWSTLPADIIADLDMLFQEALSLDEQQISPSAEEIGRRVGELARRLKGSEPDQEHIFDNRYKVLRVLGEGAMARTYQATDMQTDVIVAVKQFFQPDQVYEQVKREFQALTRVHSKHLPRIMHVQGPEHDAHVIMEYVPGITLAEIASEFPWSQERWWTFAQQLLAALAELERNGLIHRDIKPANIMLQEPGECVVLIDFGFAVGQGTSQQAAGSPLYLPPEALTAAEPPPTTDRYAAAIVLFQVLTGHLPFDRDTPGERKLVSPESSDEKQQQVTTALFRALDPDPQKRYTSVEQMRQSLQQALHTVPVIEEENKDLHEQINPWVDNLRGLYRGSSRGNADNRGLDSDFVRATYVETALDTHLRPALFAHRPKAVFLSGNPGDGKTAFLAQVQAELERQGAEQVQQDASGWEMCLNGHTFRSCYDASESHAGTSADDQLTARLHGLEGTTHPDAALTVMVAINDGRMADYFTRQQEVFGWLAKQIEVARFASSLDQVPVWVIDLKQRAFITLPDQPQESVMQRVLDRLIDAEQWNQCNTCTSQRICPIVHNATALREQAVREQLEYLLLITHLRQQRHTTMRDLRSALAYLITSNIGCEDIHRLRNSSQTGDTLLQRSYWNTAFHPLDAGDELLADITSLDPARFAHPQLDRFLYFHQSSHDAALRSRLFANGQDLPRMAFTNELNWIDAFKRRLYFEAATHPGQQNDQPEPLPYIDWHTLLPYQYATQFLTTLQQQNTHNEVLQTIARGLLHSDGVIGQKTDGFLTTTVANSVEQQLVILKQLPLTEFRLRVVQPSSLANIEAIPEILLLEHISGTPRLEINLDLFELLLRMAAGLVPDAPEFRPLLEDLEPFKSALLLQTTRDLVLIENQYRTHVITQQNGTIIRKKDKGPEVLA